LRIHRVPAFPFKPPIQNPLTTVLFVASAADCTLRILNAFPKNESDLNVSTRYQTRYFFAGFAVTPIANKKKGNDEIS
jgi:hypothetical protein